MLLLTLERALDRFAHWLGRIAAILFILLLLNVFYDVVARYLFNEVSIAMQELEWHLYAAVFMLGTPYAIKAGGHVRVDLIYERLSPRTQAWLDLGGTLVFLLPFCSLVAWYGVGFTYDSWQMGEGSADPGGLPHRWIINSLIPIAFSSMVIAGLGVVLRSINILRGRQAPDTHTKVMH